MNSHPIHRVSAFRVVGPYELEVEFSDGFKRTINFESVLAGELYGPLRDIQMFNAVKIDDEIHTLVWPNGADFDPATLYDWPDHEKAFRDMIQTWETRVAA